ncbi:tetratricopeptide repeat protein [Streptomyces sp. NPDC058694]|uniref:serine/threonine-protein kinase n=1 Tax=Streptomyces sp. NPDC058694 TaxID=3346603 RepID=UPI0036629CD2
MSKCQRPGCTGTIEDIGGGELYCDTCGLTPVRQPVGADGAGGARGARSAGGARGAGAPSGSGDLSPDNSQNSSDSSGSSPRSALGRLSHTLTGSFGGRSVTVRRPRSDGSGPTRAGLGAGLVSVPPIPRPDPATSVLENPQVPERNRYCSKSNCGAPVSRSRGDRPARGEGFCAKCGHPYSFTPKLRAGDVVHGQYEVVGCLAYGGLGWIYLALDRAVSDRWVVLKGLLDTGDEDALAAAVSERRFLAEIKHPNIVRIYNFVEHLDQRTGSLDGYIVMDYVGGKSLKEIAAERRGPDGEREPLPVEQAIAYAIEVLEALGHLHKRDLLYCDFKLDNAIQQEDRLELIDMGAVRRIDDEDSAIYGTIGYQAPEVAELGPSVASDLYTVARALAVLTFDFQGYTNVFVDSLPDPGDIPVFARYESFYRLLVRATDPDPGKRFGSAAEMADQLLGVLREVVALQTGKPRPALSTVFGQELRVVEDKLVEPLAGDTSVLGAQTPVARRGARRRSAKGSVGALPGGPAVKAAAYGAGPEPRPAGGGAAAGGVAGGTAGGAAGSVVAGSTPTASGSPFTVPVQASGPAGESGAGAELTVARLNARAAALALPMPFVDPSDPNAGFLAGLAAAAPAELVTALRTAPVDSVERRLRNLRARLEMDDVEEASRVLATLADDDHDDWRVVWHRGLTALATGDHETAAPAFDAVYDAFPGESAPKLALGICAEVLGRSDKAAEYYRLVWTTDERYVSAAFGLARVLLASGDRAGAVAALESVPEASIHFTAARVAAIRARLRERSPREPLLEDLRAAAAQVEELRQLGIDADRREQLSTEVLGSALDWVLSGSPGAGPEATGTRLLDCDLTERGLRLGMERSYRVLARLAHQDGSATELVERANRFRPWTWV